MPRKKKAKKVTGTVTQARLAEIVAFTGRALDGVRTALAAKRPVLAKSRTTKERSGPANFDLGPPFFGRSCEITVTKRGRIKAPIR